MPTISGEGDLTGEWEAAQRWREERAVDLMLRSWREPGCSIPPYRTGSLWLEAGADDRQPLPF